MYALFYSKYIVDHLGASASVVPGMDIEYEDAATGRWVYCQIKSGP